MSNRVERVGEIVERLHSTAGRIRRIWPTVKWKMQGVCCQKEEPELNGINAFALAGHAIFALVAKMPCCH